MTVCTNHGDWVSCRGKARGEQGCLLSISRSQDVQGEFDNQVKRKPLDNLEPPFVWTLLSNSPCAIIDMKLNPFLEHNMTKRIDEKIESEIVRLYNIKTENGWNGSNYISKQLGVSPQTVRSVLIRNGIKIRDDSKSHEGKTCKPVKNIPKTSAPFCSCGCEKPVEWNRAKNKWNVYADGHYRKDLPYKHKEWLEEQYNSGKTLEEIGEKFGVFGSSVKKFFKNFGLTMRPHGETLRIRGSVSGENNPAWKGGVTPERQRLYKTDEWAKLVRFIFQRDNYTCQKCGDGHTKNNKLHAHHLRSWADNPHLRLEPSNLITLCDSCHLWVHSKKNTNKDFIL